MAHAEGVPLPRAGPLTKDVPLPILGPDVSGHGVPLLARKHMEPILGPAGGGAVVVLAHVTEEVLLWP